MRLIVDGSWLCSALWWASPPETPNRFAEAITRVHGQVGASGPPIVAWDAPGCTWRKQIYPTYKNHRKPRPEALQLALLQCRRRMGMSHLEAPGFEADDVIATLADAYAPEPVAILTSDKDLCQLVCDRVRLVDLRGELTDVEAVERRWGVTPDKMRLLLSWMGDSADGLPGVKGIGPKKAIPHALAGEIGDDLTYELVWLAPVPGLLKQ